MKARTRRPLLAGVAGLVLAALAVTGPAAADTGDDSLNQILDPNQAQGTGQVVLDRGHVDFGPTLNTGEWIIEIHDDTASPSYWRRLEDVVLKVNDAAVLAVPDSETYGFLGQPAGAEVWVVPQTQKTDVVWAGWNTQEPNVLAALDLGTTLTVQGVEGPGDVIVYLQSGNFGDPQPLWSTLAPFPQQSWIEVNTHTHANWVFTEPGIYLVDVQFDADLNTGETVSARDTLRFSVGDATDAAAAFDMAVRAPAADTANPSAAPDAADDAAAASDPFGTVVWIVVGVVAVALIVAIVVVVTASRRARSRAHAARARKDAAS